MLKDFNPKRPEAKRLKSELGFSDLLQVSRVMGLPHGACYWNVRDFVARNGGEMVLGWMINWRKGHLIQCCHHAVLRYRGGELFDITAPTPNGPFEGSTCFAPDDSIEVDLSGPVMVPNRFLLLKDTPLLREYVTVSHQHSALVAHMNSIAKRDGVYRDYRPGTQCVVRPPSAEMMALLPQIGKLNQIWNDLFWQIAGRDQ